jgi:hypothetical protein
VGDGGVERGVDHGLHAGGGSSAKPGSNGFHGLGSLVTSATVATSLTEPFAGST